MSILFTREGREKVAKILSLLVCEKGFLDYEGIPVEDETALKMLLARAATPPQGGEKNDK